jgi:hypothetical protein
MIKKVLVGLLLASGVTLAKNSVELNFNDKSLELGASMHLNYYAQLDPASMYLIDVNYLKVDNKPNITQVGFSVANPFEGANKLVFGMGLKYIFASNSKTDEDLHAVAINAHAKYMLTQKANVKFSTSFSPNILVFSDGERYLDTKLTLEYQVVRSGFVYVGHRYERLKYETAGNIKYTNSAMLGMKFVF